MTRVLHTARIGSVDGVLYDEIYEKRNARDMMSCSSYEEYFIFHILLSSLKFTTVGNAGTKLVTLDFVVNFINGHHAGLQTVFSTDYKI